MLNSTALAVVGLLLASVPAQAEWLFDQGEDALDDTKFATIVAPSRDGNWFLMLKCYEGKPDNTFMILLTGETFDVSADYLERVQALIRFDKGDKQEITLKPRNSSGKFSLETYSALTPDFLDHVQSMGEAKKQIVFGLAEQAVTFSASGSAKTFKKFRDTCKLP